MRSFLLILVLLYAGGDLAIHQTHTKVWEKDKASYVIFPEGNMGKALYYAWRPMSCLDGQLTATGAHIGSHN